MSKVAQEGLVVPKARKAFAIFLKERSCVKPGACKFEFAAAMKRLGQVWSSLLDAEKAPYQDQSKAEFLARRAALLQIGIPLRNIISKQKEIQPQQTRGAVWVKAHMEKCLLADAGMVAPVP